MIARRSAVLVATVTLAVALSACTPAAAPTPTPSPTGFASKEEAFAAAEATYRAYVDALNKVDLSDPATFEPVYALLDGAADEASRKSFSQMHADGWKVSGRSTVELTEPVQVSDVSGQVEIAVCVNVSAVKLVDKNGVSLTDSRPDIQSLTVKAAEKPSGKTRAVITEFSSRTGEPQC